MKIHNLQYEVSGDQCCGQVMTGLIPVTSEFSVSCCYFEFDEHTNAKLNTYLEKNWGGMLCLTLCSLISSCYLLLFFVTVNSCVVTCVHEVNFA